MITFNNSDVADLNYSRLEVYSNESAVVFTAYQNDAHPICVTLNFAQLQYLVNEIARKYDVTSKKENSFYKGNL